ncbi:hypothetical protein ED733_005810 [Metarhizium rileyi]|uniref:Xylanolytic transcriptional activator regulatory domain-containing protein n=1 Tax=Metarhizium rileyi (strain RCEF 4871) TaxID=1649241 RepID=A0A5C6GC83_METRR|nr:hypothetical protein ED733_005810 [Metarhizium rileyi]
MEETPISWGRETTTDKATTSSEHCPLVRRKRLQGHKERSEEESVEHVISVINCVQNAMGNTPVPTALKKKRGKASRKQLAERAAAQAAAGTTNQTAEFSDGKEPSKSPATDERAGRFLESTGSNSISGSSLDTVHNNHLPAGNSIGSRLPKGHPATTQGQFGELSDQPSMPPSIHISPDDIGESLCSNYGGLSANYGWQGLRNEDMMDSNHSYSNTQQNSIHGCSDLSFGILGQYSNEFSNSASFRFSVGPLEAHSAFDAASCPGWGVPMSSPPGRFQTQMQHNELGQSALRYPVLEPILPHIANIIPIHLACDLIDTYFASSSAAGLHPMSPCVLGSVFRKRSLLHPKNPRKCQPALLASMMWVAAQTSEASVLTNVPPAREKTCQELLELTIGLLKPLIHGSSLHVVSNASQTASASAVPLGGFGMGLPGSISIDVSVDDGSGALGIPSGLDDLVTCIHLAAVISDSSGYQGAGLRWWNVVWSMARELKLGRELPPSEPRPTFEQGEMEGNKLGEQCSFRNSTGFVSEEEREERRRVWWHVYTVDRHLALCYNRPLFLLDAECEGLRQPLDDTVWQSGDFLNDPSDWYRSGLRSRYEQALYGPQFECRGHGAFGYFLPLMTILGEIVDLHHARNHPRFGSAVRASREYSDQIFEVRRHLEAYEKSLERMEMQSSSTQVIHGHRVENHTLVNLVHDETQRALESNSSSASAQPAFATASSCVSEAEVQTRTVLAYGKHVMHILHILLEGKWDPIDLFDDDDAWTSSPGFVTASGHAVAATEAINQILDHDPALSFMPSVFNVYLLQGSFLLLLIAEKLPIGTSLNVVRACETIVRAHEACGVTLGTRYQVNNISQRRLK